MHNDTPITVNRHSTQEEREAALRRIYQQVLERQPYQSERRRLSKLEKDFLKNKIGVRRFLKELGSSNLYLDAFYFQSSNPKFLENCFKHFLGRSILDAEEMHTYCDILIRDGVTHLINSILDSEEYRKHFGCFTVPYNRTEQCYESPNTYLETTVIRNEHYGQRGWSLPTLYWHQLGMNCDEGKCTYPDVPSTAIERDEAVAIAHAAETQAPQAPEPEVIAVAASAPSAEPAQDELMELLWGMDA
jgi:hypothetical protein